MMMEESLSDYELDYKEIGYKVSHFRKACGLSQAQLAEMIDISTTHLSHIETGGTKMSLPVFVKLAKALSIRTDDLLPASGLPTASEEAPDQKKEILSDINDILVGCSGPELMILRDIIPATIAALRKY